MTVDESIDKLLRRIQRRGLASPEIIIYAEGVKAKLMQARFSLENLRGLEHIPDSAQVHDATASFSETLTVSQKIEFYCECFWDFLRSSFDIAAQLINVLHPSLHLNERQTDFKTIADSLRHFARDTSLERAIYNCRRSTAFKHLEEYRHCSTHRRQVYISRTTVTQTVSTDVTRGYFSDSTTTQHEFTNTYLCKNPEGITPVFDMNRPIVFFCEQLLKATDNRMKTIINRLPPV